MLFSDHAAFPVVDEISLSFVLQQYEYKSTHFVSEEKFFFNEPTVERPLLPSLYFCTSYTHTHTHTHTF